MTDASAHAIVALHGDMWATVLYEPLYSGADVYLPAVGPVSPAYRAFEGPAEWLRDRGYDVVSWKAIRFPYEGFRAELREL